MNDITNMENNITLQSINPISITSDKYGNDLNDRLNSIQSNFETLVKTNYLKGDAGNSVAMMEFILNNKNNNDDRGLYFNDGTQVTGKKLYDIIYDLISKSVEEGGLESVSENIEWDTNLNNSKIHLYYEIKNENGVEKKYVISSLPYIFIDNRFANITNQNPQEYDGLFDTSCIVIYNSNSQEFEKIQSFPTIYYHKNDNEEMGNFCWKINGQLTNIPCQGPRGDNGDPALGYIVKIDNLENPSKIGGSEDKYEVTPRPIKSIFCATEKIQEDGTSTHIFEWKPKMSDDMVFSDGQLCICIFEDENNENNFDLGFGFLIYNPSGSTSNFGGYAVITDKSYAFNKFQDSWSLIEALSNLKNIESNYSGIFIPYTNKSENGEQSGHTLWVDKEENSLHIGPVKNVLNENLEIDNETSTANELNVHYGNIILDNDNKEVKIQSKNEENLIIEGHDCIRLNTTSVTANIDISDTTELNATKLNLKADELNLDATDVITLDCAYITIGDENDGRITLNGENTSVNINADGFAVNGENVNIQGNSNISIADTNGDSISLLNGGINIQSSDDIVIHSQGGSIDLEDTSKVKFENSLKIGEKMKDKQIAGQFNINTPSIMDKQTSVLGASMRRRGDIIDQKLYGSYNISLSIVDPGLYVKWYSYLPSNNGTRPIGGKMHVYNVEVVFYDENNNVCSGYDNYRQTIINQLEDNEFSPGEMVTFYMMSTVRDNESDFSLVINVSPDGDGENQVLTEIPVTPNSTNQISIPPLPYNIWSMDLVSKVKIDGGVIPHKAKIQAQYDVIESTNTYNISFEMDVQSEYSVIQGDYGVQSISYECERNTWPRLTVWKENEKDNLELGFPECNSYLHIDSSNIIIRYSNYGIRLSDAGIQYTEDVDDVGEGGSDRWHPLI